MTISLYQTKLALGLNPFGGLGRLTNAMARQPRAEQATDDSMPDQAPGDGPAIEAGLPDVTIGVTAGDSVDTARGTLTGPGVVPPPTGEATGAAAEAGPDPQQLHQLVIDHGDAIYRLALSIVRDSALAEDVAQETLVKAWQALPSLRNPSAARSWVLRIAHNTSISMLRTRRAVVVDPHEMPERSTTVDRSVETHVQSGVVMGQFVEALDDLDDLSRSIVVLRELEGLSYDEIAEMLAVPLPTVKTRLLRARRRLGANLREWT